MTQRATRRPLAIVENMDYQLLLAALTILFFGVVMVTSASVSVADGELGDPFYFGKKQFIYTAIGVLLGSAALLTPTRLWERGSFLCLGLAFLVLAMALVPGIGKTVNGASRWIGVGSLTLQASEFARLGIMIYLAAYLVRQSRDVRGSVRGFVKPLSVIVLASVLLLSEPDFGATVVLCAVMLGTLFLAGARLTPFVISFLVMVVMAAALAIYSPYRAERVVAFLDPWGNAFGSGYQLTQSLIAFGSGGVTGLGLGSSVQKLFYLPEAHNDFVFAIVGEELGLIGVVSVIALFALMIYRCFAIGTRALALEAPFRGYFCYSVAIWLSCQVFINMGVSLGMLPTKGLTLPLMSAGGSAVMVACVSLAIVLRAHLENRQAQSQAQPMKRRKSAGRRTTTPDSGTLSGEVRDAA